jgi:hypothetical protein
VERGLQLDEKACPERSEGSQKIKAHQKFAPAPFYGVSSLRNPGKKYFSTGFLRPLFLGKFLNGQT